MQNPDSSQIIPIPVAKVSNSDLIRQLSAENFKLRQVIDEMANELAVQEKLIQQLRDEIASLKKRCFGSPKNSEQLLLFLMGLLKLTI